MTLLNVTVSPRPVVAGKNFSLDLDLQNGNVFFSISESTSFSELHHNH
jgi:hypothetical protein